MKKFASNFLTFLEKREEKLLSWGFHNFSYSESEMLLALKGEGSNELLTEWQNLQLKGLTFRQLVREMRREQLLFRLPGSNNQYRTRMAEGIRLLAGLRQTFKQEDWASGPSLVSDIKVHLQSRNYPRRNINRDDVWRDYLSESVTKKHLKFTESNFKALSEDGPDNQFEFSGFQARSFQHIYAKYFSKDHTGSIVSAGTGSGKTKAFYVPAFLRVAEEIREDPKPFTKIIAIYPRNVLLADQLREASSEAEKLLKNLSSNEVRAISFGALLGDTPWSQWFTAASRKRWHWKKVGGDHVIPYLKSPIDGKSDLLWKESDRKVGNTSLFRVGEPKPDIPNGILRITREDLIANPPDVLFVSLEMLNREMGNPSWAKTFGINQGSKSPRLVLLDEVHTYEGISGAQAAWVLRRWKYWTKSYKGPNVPHFVGLSATLNNATEHLSRLCGIFPNKVVNLAPKKSLGNNNEIVSEGQEYNVTVKGDPSSGASLLSTSIQTGMLFARLLTPLHHVDPHPRPIIAASDFFSKKIFGFTDNLDSLNRWFGNMRDAEYKKLASLREIPNPPPTIQELIRMREEAQIWELPTEIGHDLNQSLDVKRCSSQDPGVDVRANLVLATASLEVGFDDPEVGVILHHKAPMSMSSFVQRKGKNRAGRTRGTRPWTVVVLSDYGKDRWTFQSSERLFNPEIDRIGLPVFNPYIIRIQVAMFLMDWVGTAVNLKESPFDYLRGPANWSSKEAAQRKSKALFKDFLKQGDSWSRFFNDALSFFMKGRGLNWHDSEDNQRARNELQDIFWGEPRPLLVEAIPAIVRKLEANWQRTGSGSSTVEDVGAKRPLPDFIPGTTFQELSTKEGRIALEAFRGKEKEDEFLPIQQFLREACPGNVSKRFSSESYGRLEPGYWHEFSLKLDEGNNRVLIDDIYPDRVLVGKSGNTEIFQPLAAEFIHVEDSILESTSSSWEWCTSVEITCLENAEEIPLYVHPFWGTFFKRAVILMHKNSSWVEMTRFANQAEFEIRKRKGESIRGLLNLENSNQDSCSVGFQLQTDCVRFQLSRTIVRELLEKNFKLVASLRYEYFLHHMRESRVLRLKMNSFLVGWMAEISIAMLCATAIRRRKSLEEAQEILLNKRTASAQKVMETIFQVVDASSAQEHGDSRLKRNIQSLWSDDEVVEEVSKLERLLWTSSYDQEFFEWVEDRVVSTVAQGLRLAVATSCDQSSEDDFVVDVMRLSKEYEIYLTEKSSGGLGHIEKASDSIRQDPRYFFDALGHALSDCTRESWANELVSVVSKVSHEHVTSGGNLSTSFDSVRDAQDLIATQEAKAELIDALRSIGMNCRRGNISAINMKILRPGSSKNTDILTYILNAVWKRRSEGIGITIPPRTFAYLVCEYEPSKRRLAKMFRGEFSETPSSGQLFSIVQQLLFEGCNDSCPDCLDNPNMFNHFGKPDRKLVRRVFKIDPIQIEMTGDWVAKARSALTNHGDVTVISIENTTDESISGLTSIFFEELNLAGYQESILVNSISRVGSRLEISFRVRNFNHAES